MRIYGQHQIGPVNLSSTQHLEQMYVGPGCNNIFTRRDEINWLPKVIEIMEQCNERRLGWGNPVYCINQNHTVCKMWKQYIEYIIYTSFLNGLLRTPSLFHSCCYSVCFCFFLFSSCFSSVSKNSTSILGTYYLYLSV